MEDQETYNPEDVARILLYYDRFLTNVCNGYYIGLEEVVNNIPPNVRVLIEERIKLLKAYGAIRSVPM